MSGRYVIGWDYQPPLLRVSVTGQDASLPVTLAYWRQIAAQVRACGASLVLFLDGIEGEVLPEADLAAFFEAMEGEGLRDVRVAYVEHSLEQMANIEAVEMLAREHGYNVRMFAHEGPALDWLRYGE